MSSSVCVCVCAARVFVFAIAKCVVVVTDLNRIEQQTNEQINRTECAMTKSEIPCAWKCPKNGNHLYDNQIKWKLIWFYFFDNIRRRRECDAQSKKHIINGACVRVCTKQYRLQSQSNIYVCIYPSCVCWNVLAGAREATRNSVGIVRMPLGTIAMIIRLSFVRRQIPTNTGQSQSIYEHIMFTKNSVTHIFQLIMFGQTM